jgi:hypothetical protein
MRMRPENSSASAKHLKIVRVSTGTGTVISNKCTGTAKKSFWRPFGNSVGDFATSVFDSKSPGAS